MSFKDTKLPLDEVLKYLPMDKRENINIFLESSKLKPHWYATNAFNVKFLGKIIYRFSISKSGNISLFFTVAERCDTNNVIFSLPEDMKRFYFDNLRLCTHCNPSHGNGRIVNILGTEYGVCAEPEMRIDNPTKLHLDYLIKFIEIRKANIREDKHK
jgi:hypothetical protein